MKTVAIVQARSGSTRLPGKVLQHVAGQPLLAVLVARLQKSHAIDQVVLATSTEPRDDAIAALAKDIGVLCHRGSEQDVLDRFAGAASLAKADVVVRITGDCPLIDATIVDQVIAARAKADVDYASNIDPPSYPDGLDTEVFTMAALLRAHAETQRPYDREHVTPYLRETGLFTKTNVESGKNLSGLRWTVDEASDLATVRRVFDHFNGDMHFSWTQVLDLQEKQPRLFGANADIARNEGGAMGTGQKLWKRAKNLIPGGNMLLSKRAEMFLPEQWPAYFSKSKGCKVWDMDGQEFEDVSLMGIGTNTLGYAHDEVDDAVRATISNGNLSTLNCPEEVYLAERLIGLHPWADMARFTRSGGEANAVGIRIARAASGRDKVAFCGYHGWHDWYLSANLGDEKSLAGHLLPGLSPNGVPQALQGTVLPFNYNDFAGLEQLTVDHDIGVIKMEVSRNKGPEDNFLHKVRELATRKGIVLFFDECTSGFRQTFGGLHKLYGVEPDIAVFGKTLGNGYAINAIIGRRAVMEAAQTSFISSTFWTERIGPTAALKTLDVMEREKSWEQITATGEGIRKRWQEMADNHGIAIEHWGLPALAGFTIKSEQALAYKTLITQEMLAKGFLAGNSVYASLAHTPDVIDRYFDAIDPIFKVIKSCEDGADVMALLKGPVCHSGFKRLN
jgi:glutamate-1-semialdehyde 2,1-aminomutase